jgi:cyclopropane fatty-acyl-phospholipid synthase-like methyltransferase
MRYNLKKPQHEAGWVVKNVRPEEELGDPNLYYTDEVVEKYAKSGGMRRAQEKISMRVVELLKERGIEEGSDLLDLGCGPGYTMDVYYDEGYNVIGVDLMEKMVENAKKKDFEVYHGDMRNLKHTLVSASGRKLKLGKFDAVVSVSALQWVKDMDEIKKVAEGIYSLLEKGGLMIIQFYPKSEQELKDIAHVFAVNGFKGKIIIDSPEHLKNRLIFLVMERE